MFTNLITDFIFSLLFFSDDEHKPTLWPLSITAFWEFLSRVSWKLSLLLHEGVSPLSQLFTAMTLWQFVTSWQNVCIYIVSTLTVGTLGWLKPNALSWECFLQQPWITLSLICLVLTLQMMGLSMEGTRRERRANTTCTPQGTWRPSGGRGK